jgi:hypothetical protein
VVAPGLLGGERWPLRHDKVITAMARAIAHAHSKAVPGYLIDARKDIPDPQTMPVAHGKSLHPAYAVAGWRPRRARFRGRPHRYSPRPYSAPNS